MRMAYRECRELVEESELYSEENGRMPLRCRVYLLIRESWSMEELLCCWWQLPEVRYCTNRFGRRKTVDMEGVHHGRYETRGKEKA